MLRKKSKKEKNYTVHLVTYKDTFGDCNSGHLEPAVGRDVCFALLYFI